MSGVTVCEYLCVSIFYRTNCSHFLKSGNSETAAACCRHSTNKCQHCVADSSISFHAKGEENLKPVCPHGSASQRFPTHKLLKSFNSFIKERQNSVSPLLHKQDVHVSAARFALQIYHLAEAASAQVLGSYQQKTVHGIALEA